MDKMANEAVSSDNWTSFIDGTSTAKVVIIDTILILVVSTVAIFLSSAISSSSRSWKLRWQGRPPLPPGSLGLPFFGETISYIANINTFAQIRFAKYGPIFKSNVMGETVFLQAPASNKFLFSNESKLVQMSWPQSVKKLLGDNSMFNKTGDGYRRARRHINPLFSPSNLEQYLPRIEHQVVTHLAKFWQPSALADTGRGEENEFEIGVWDSVNKIAFEIVVDLLLSLSPDDSEVDFEELRGLFKLWTSGLVSLSINVPGTLHYRAMKARARILEVLGGLIAKRRVDLAEGKATASEDFLSYFLTAPDDGGELMSEEEMKDNLLLLVNAGHSTSSHTMTLMLRSIALHPEVHDLLKKEHDSITKQKGRGEGLTKEDLANMTYTWCVIQETMRMHSPIAGGFRELMKDVEYDGYTLPKGWKMNWNTEAHMNPEFFKNPTTFDPTRFEETQAIVPYTYTPFGGGLRMCPGNDFAKMEMLIYMHHVLRNYNFTLIHPDEPVFHTPMPSQKSGTPMRISKLR